MQRPMQQWSEVRNLDWRQWPGAYGHERDVAGALETLRFGTNVDDDAFSNAWLEVLYAHVWHQGTLYPVTAHVLPFVFDIIEASPALTRRSEARREIARFVLCCAASARRDLTAQQGDLAAAHSVLAALSAHSARVRSWFRTDLETIALAVLLNVPEETDSLLGGSEVRPERLLAAILVHSGWVPQGLLPWASTQLSRRSTHPVATRACRLLESTDSRAIEANEARFAALASAIRGRGGLDKHLESLRDLFGITATPSLLGESSGAVIVTDDDWFVVQGARKLTIRWPAHPFVEGDQLVLVDINERNCAREVRGTAEKAHRYAIFDAVGKLVSLT
jgi:hypothetical protein